MITLASLFADFDFKDVAAEWQNMDSSTQQTFLVFGAILLVILLVLAWAVFLRRSRRKHHSHDHHHSRATAILRDAKVLEGVAAPTPRRRWRRRRSNRQRNPTLAETGGLPPVRTEPPPEPPL